MLACDLGLCKSFFQVLPGVYLLGQENGIETPFTAVTRFKSRRGRQSFKQFTLDCSSASESSSGRHDSSESIACIISTFGQQFAFADSRWSSPSSLLPV